MCTHLPSAVHTTHAQAISRISVAVLYLYRTTACTVLAEPRNAASTREGNVTVDNAKSAPLPGELI
jgi:hypothetical protein